MNDNLPNIDETVMLFLPTFNKEVKARYLGEGVKTPTQGIIDYKVFQCFPEDKPSFAMAFGKDEEIKWRRL